MKSDKWMSKTTFFNGFIKEELYMMQPEGFVDPKEANDDYHETSNQVTTEPRRSTRLRSAPEWYGNLVLEVMLLDHDEPTNYEEAMMSPDSAKWFEAMKSEI